jgi:hypothetical protein
MKNSFLPLPCRLAAAAAAFSILAAAALAQAPAPGTPAGTPPAPAAEKPKPLSSMDKKFVTDAGKSLFYQLQLHALAKTAITDTTSPVAKFRDTTTGNLNKALESLKNFAQSRGETLPTDLTGTEKSSADRLGKLQEDKFAKHYIGDLAKESKHLATAFEQASKSAQDPELKTWATNYGPMIKTAASAAETAEKGLSAKKK